MWERVVDGLAADVAGRLIAGNAGTVAVADRAVALGYLACHHIP